MDSILWHCKGSYTTRSPIILPNTGRMFSFRYSLMRHSKSQSTDGHKSRFSDFRQPIMTMIVSITYGSWEYVRTHFEIFVLRSDGTVTIFCYRIVDSELAASD